ncbi:hypothetical protein E2320_014162 [Naja naja]|nr:hypothetical protein E2320_014162 [Naja naja]
MPSTAGSCPASHGLPWLRGTSLLSLWMEDHQEASGLLQRLKLLQDKKLQALLELTSLKRFTSLFFLFQPFLVVSLKLPLPPFSAPAVWKISWEPNSPCPGGGDKVRV